MTAIGWWKLNDVALADTDVKVAPTAATFSCKVRQALEAIHGGSQVREGIGVDLPTKTLTISCIGQGDGKWDMAAFIIGVLTSNDTWTLEAPTGYYVIPKFSRAVFSTQSISEAENAGESVAKVVLNVDAIVNGVYPRDGGNYVESLSYREDFLSNDFWAATNTAGMNSLALLWNYRQRVSYPKGVPNTSPFTPATLAYKWLTIGIGEGQEEISAAFDASGYFFGEPLAEGTGGPGKFTFSPEAPASDGADTFSYLQVSTRLNDFSLTSASAPFLVGVGADAGSIIAGPAATTSVKTMVAAGDDTTATVNILQVTAADGLFVLKRT